MGKCLASNSPRAEIITIQKALSLRKDTGRFKGYCIVCNGEVVAHKASKYGAAHFEHKPYADRPAEGPLRDKWESEHEERKNELV